MKTTAKLAAAGLSVLLACGCATVFTGTKDEILIVTDPEDARVYVDGRMVGQGETTITVTRSGPPPQIRVEKDGYRTQEFQPEAEFNAIAMINSTLVFSWATDILSGSVLHYAEDEYYVQLVPKDSAGPTPRQRITRFVLANAVMLRKDLATGDGEYLDGLAALAASGDREAGFRARLRGNTEALLAADGPRGLAEVVGRLYRDAGAGSAG